jgi:hypothetical protein
MSSAMREDISEGLARVKRKLSKRNEASPCMLELKLSII